MPRCEHKNIIVGSFQVGNVNAPVKLELDDQGEIVGFEFVNPTDRAGGELSDPVFYLEEVAAGLALLLHQLELVVLGVLHRLRRRVRDRLQGRAEGRLNMPHSYRLVVCIDVDAQSTLEAYGKVYEAMGKVTGPGTGLDWESSDEAYTPDAEPISEEELSKVRMAYLAEHGAK